MAAIRDGTFARLPRARINAGGSQLAAEFDRFFEDLRRELDRLANAPMRMLPTVETFGSAGVVTDARAAFGRVCLVDPTNGDINVIFPPATDADIGGFVGIRRGSASNVVTLVAPDASATFAGATTFTLPASPTPARVYLFYYEGRRLGFLPINDA